MITPSTLNPKPFQIKAANGLKEGTQKSQQKWDEAFSTSSPRPLYDEAFLGNNIYVIFVQSEFSLAERQKGFTNDPYIISHALFNPSLPP